MSTNATQQTARELEVFARFISIARLPIDPDSVQKCDPPAPDILCHHDTDGPLAFELTELINHKFSERLWRQSDTQGVLVTAYEQLSAPDKLRFDQHFGNTNFYFKFLPGTTTSKVRGNIADLFGELANLSDGFEGVNHFHSKSLSKVVESVSVSRGGFNGPIFSVENIGGLGDSVVPAIQNKLGKTYQSDHPIELLGYLDLAATFPPQLWQGPAYAFFAGLSNLGPFRRIWIVDIRNESVEIVHPTA